MRTSADRKPGQKLENDFHLFQVEDLADKQIDYGSGWW